ncbi:hypothetical protein B1R94_06300 [Mycolicibacterium litorale]|nr:hypothetical protein B1R94_06300 [Mycolicibacterium litorale]
MQVFAFAASRTASLEEVGGVNAGGFPMTSCYVENIPAQISVPLVLAVHTPGGSDYQVRRYIIAKSPAGERVGMIEVGWDWPDEPGFPVKFRVFAPPLPMTVYSPGVYTIGLYEHPDSEEPEFSFPLPVLRLNPLTGTPTN